MAQILPAVPSSFTKVRYAVSRHPVNDNAPNTMRNVRDSGGGLDCKGCSSDSTCLVAAVVDDVLNGFCCVDVV